MPARPSIRHPAPALLALLAIAPLGCSRLDERQGPLTLTLISPTFSAGAIPRRCSCDGAGISPALSWSAPPTRTRSFALTLTDLDSPLGYSFVHWVLYNLPAAQRSLPEGAAHPPQLPPGAGQGLNDDGHLGYVPPCPPGHSPHRYRFVLYALDTTLPLAPGATKKQLLQSIARHALARGELIGRFQH